MRLAILHEGREDPLDPLINLKAAFDSKSLKEYAAKKHGITDLYTEMASVDASLFISLDTESFKITVENNKVIISYMDSNQPWDYTGESSFYDIINYGNLKWATHIAPIIIDSSVEILKSREDELFIRAVDQV